MPSTKSTLQRHTTMTGSHAILHVMSLFFDKLFFNPLVAEISIHDAIHKILPCSLKLSVRISKIFMQVQCFQMANAIDRAIKAFRCISGLRGKLTITRRSAFCCLVAASVPIQSAYTVS